MVVENTDQLITRVGSTHPPRSEKVETEECKSIDLFANMEMSENNAVMVRPGRPDKVYKRT